MKARHRTWTTFLLSITIIAGGCTSLQPVADSPEAIEEIVKAGKIVEVGDRIEILTVAGKRHTLTVTDLSPDHIVGTNRSGETQSFSVSDLALLKSYRVSGGKTVSFTLAGVLVAASVALATVGVAAYPQ